MKNRLLYFILFISFGSIAYSQSLKEKIIFSNYNVPKSLNKLDKGSFDRTLYSRQFQDNATLNHLSLPAQKLNEFRYQFKSIDVDRESGIPTQFEGIGHWISRSAEVNNEASSQMLNEYLGLTHIAYLGFNVLNSEMDELNIQHVSLVQTAYGIPIHGAEYRMHFYPDQHVFGHGRAFNLAPGNPNPVLSEDDAVEAMNQYFIKNEIHQVNSKAISNVLKGGILKKELCFKFNAHSSKWTLCYFFNVIPNPAQHWDLYIDAMTGEVVDAYSKICNIMSDECKNLVHCVSPLGAEVANAQDLSNTTRTINTWKEGSTYYMIDGSRAMFKLSASSMPDDPNGGIMTVNGQNRSPSSSSFVLSHISSSNNTWSDRTAVSAHFNAGKAYEYFLNTHSRNSINGSGGTILSIINVADDNGKSMDNAFWNGEAMFYGNGAQAFTPLAKALDVGGHEMSHGVIQNTANLMYQGESGALNESFADIFGAMIDRDDWKMGEDVVVKSFFPSGALRDLSNPNNGGTSINQPYWQPKHVNEKYKGTQDNGGVHINSGIPNFAFYLFVQELRKNNRSEEDAKKIAEKVFFHTLKNYLTRSSQFVDLRIGVEKCATDLFGNVPDVLASVKTAFDQVGIPGTPNGGGGTQPKKDLSINPGKEFLVCTDANKDGVYLYDFINTPTQISSTSIISKPSVTDDGSEIYFVAKTNKLHMLTFNKSTGKYVESILDNTAVYRNAIISKDGTLLAALLTKEENIIHVYDFLSDEWKDFTLYNPTSTSSTTSDVRYADFMDFDHSGQNIIYDAFNVIKRANGNDYEYWDIGSINVFNLPLDKFGTGQVDKLFTDLPENTSIGNPVYSKNSLDVIAFDYVESDLFSSTYALLGANIEKGDVDAIAENRAQLAYPSFSVKDNQVAFDSEDNQGDQSINTKGLAASKIVSSGSEKILLTGAKWGTWFANGKRNLIRTADIKSLNEMSIYPNPFDQEFTLGINSKKFQWIQINILNQMGQLIESKKIQLKEGSNEERLDLSHCIQGIYHLQIVNAEGSISAKLFKQ